MLGMKRRCLIVEVVVRSRADGGRPSDRCQNECLLVEVKYAEPIGVFTPKPRWSKFAVELQTRRRNMGGTRGPVGL